MCLTGASQFQLISDNQRVETVVHFALLEVMLSFNVPCAGGTGAAGQPFA